MAKRKENRQPQTQTKKLKAKKKTTDRDNDDDASEEEEKLKRKVKPTPRLLSNRNARNTSTVTTSKYFQSPTKEDEDSEDDFDMEMSPPPRGVSTSYKKQEEVEDDSEEDEDNWEEVEELSEPLGPSEPSDPALPYESVEIEIETPEVRKKQKKKAEFETYLRRMMMRFKKDLHTDTHKVHLMCLIASGMFRNKLCSEPDLLAVTLSLIPAHFSSVSKERMDQHYLSGLLKWFRSTFTLNPSLPSEERPDPRALLERRLSSLSARDHQEMTHLFLLVLRSLQLFCRLVLSLQPIPLKQAATKVKSGRTLTKSRQETSTTNSPGTKVSPGTKRPAGGGKVKAERGGKRVRRKEIEEEDEDEEDNKPAAKGRPKPKNLKRRSVASKISYKEESNSEEEECERLSDEEFEAVSDVDSEDSEGGATSRAGRSKNKTSAATKRKSGGGKKTVKEEEEWKEVRVEEEEDEMTSSGTKIRRSGGKKREGPGSDEWLEVYLQKSSSWVCVDVDHGVGMPHLCSQNATAPLTYVVSVDQEGFVKDLGRKYDPTWMTTSRKRRVDESWWEETLQPLLGPEDEKDVKEEKELQNKLLNKPLPISITEYKNHPLYALKRHLLKYEAIYPPTAAVLGYCRKEPVYSRDCVHTLHSKDTWLKEARTVRLGEEPYKMVKGFSNRSRKARMVSEQKEEKDLPLFGDWQTEEYQPPIAVDGKVPRNDYGNVYLFKPCMLPVGCVHLRLPNLHRVARKLDLDAAPAVTGFDFHGGYSHAVSDGYIVCEEHEEILRAAWVEDQENQKQKEREKKEKRATSNWTLLVKGLLIRERLKQRYSKKNQGLASTTGGQNADNGFSSDEGPAESGSCGGKTASETLALSWPQNRQKEEDNTGVSGLKKKRKTKREKKGEEQHLFPFEKV